MTHFALVRVFVCLLKDRRSCLTSRSPNLRHVTLATGHATTVARYLVHSRYSYRRKEQASGSLCTCRRDQKISSLGIEHLSIEKLSTWTSEEKYGCTHVCVMTIASPWVRSLTVQRALLMLVRVPGRHLRRKHPWSDRVYSDLSLYESRGHHPSQVQECRLGGCVSKLPV